MSEAVGDHGFPPHSCGGLIEAAFRQLHGMECLKFSPAFVRGPH